MKKTTAVPSLSIRRNCNLELCLVPPCSSSSSAAAAIDTYSHHHQDRNSMTQGSDASPQQRLTIFFDGKVSVCDVTELQAREILNLARRDMTSCSTPFSSEPSPAATQAVVQSQLKNPDLNGICMQRSLQRFLQKRKSRIQATSPYHNKS
ncbi:hypothetical protein MKW94_018889 [Papaver nudicaule]|uniref:Protein TIFY n=1 Tax=Papaver nudicaule TaxID=74823 RepID=A0AA41VX21_PAPNU|nr:hypothetical protein [Papaver nudicaule]